MAVVRDMKQHMETSEGTECRSGLEQLVAGPVGQLKPN